MTLVGVSVLAPTLDVDAGEGVPIEAIRSTRQFNQLLKPIPTVLSDDPLGRVLARLDPRQPTARNRTTSRPARRRMHSRLKPATAAMDMGYDNNRVYAECAECGVAAVIPLRKNQGERDLRIPRKSDEWRGLYRRRSCVER